MQPLYIEPEIGVPMPIKKGEPYFDLRERIDGLFQTAKALEAVGATWGEPDAIDKEVAATLLMGYAEEPEKVSKQVTTQRASTLTTEAIIQTKAILDEFSHIAVQSAVQIRNLITNKLILETENKDARVRLRALELLGKISDVGLFTDKTEITMRHRPTAELEQLLRERLTKVIDGDTYVRPPAEDPAQPLDVSTTDIIAR